MSENEDNQLEMSTGYDGVLRLRLVPKTSIALTSALKAPTALAADVTLSGSTLNLPDATKARFTWIVQRGKQQTFPIEGVPIKVTSKTQASVTVHLDVCAHRLVGKGTLGFEIAPDFPYCPAQLVSAATTFDNPLDVQLSGPSTKQIGTKLTVSPVIGAMFRDSTVRVDIFKRSATGGKPALAQSFTWKGRSDAHEWRVGCQPGTNLLAYQDELPAAERPTYAFDYAISVAPDGTHFTEVFRSEAPVVSVPRPKLESFDIAVEESNVLDSGLTSVVAVMLKNLTRDEAHKIPTHLYRARGKVSGFDPDLDLPLTLALWKVDPETGKVGPFTPNKATRPVEKTVAVRDDGSFDVVLLDFCAVTDEEDWSLIGRTKFFGVLSVPPSATGTGATPVPLNRVMDYDALVFPPCPDVGVAKAVTVRSRSGVAPPVGEVSPAILGAMYGSCEIKPERLAAVKARCELLLANKARYDAVAAEVKIPWFVIACAHSLESDVSFKHHLHNGDPLTARTVQVPAGRPKAAPKSGSTYTWEESALDVLTMKGYTDWGDVDIGFMLDKLERYNGIGYRSRKIYTPYLWSFSQFYQAGKFVADGKFDASAVSGQCGAAVLILWLEQNGKIPKLKR
jgi:lysozyme family protein